MSGGRGQIEAPHNLNRRPLEPGMGRRQAGSALAENGEACMTEANTNQSVRRKGGKKGKGHVYIICNLNPKHKQRQG